MGLNQTDLRLLDALTSDGRIVPFCTTNRQLAARLHYSLRAVMCRVERLKRLTGCRNRAALAVWWINETEAK
jgi:DNA-binding Lrp family transcriptional regulator